MDGDDQYFDIRQRLKPICKRTLRRQILEYIKYTNRSAITQEFYPTEEEQQLFELVSDYLRRERLYALPASQRHLMTLILRRLLASSTYAISGTLEALSQKLDALVEETKMVDDSDLFKDYETYEEQKDEWQEESSEPAFYSKPSETFTWVDQPYFHPPERPGLVQQSLAL